ncbi:MAG: hypothetical protein K0Q55_676 [Verrucomicrobia bacterium]|jgi:hypothetical protein|nr:hypothetical protein [Verrucomicrobiota bacterium]
MAILDIFKKKGTLTEEVELHTYGTMHPKKR